MAMIKYYIEILLKIFSLVIAGVNIFILILDLSDKGNYWDPRCRTEDIVEAGLVMAGLLALSLYLIWFGEYVSEHLELVWENEWNPTWLIKTIGWALLLFPLIIFLIVKYHMIILK